MKKKRTILVLASTFPRWKNDTEPRFVYDLCQRLKNEFKIIVLAPHAKNTKKQESFNGLTVVRYRYAPARFERLAYEGGITAKLKENKLYWLLLPFFFLGQWTAIIKLLKKYPVKVIHAHWLIPQGFLALLARAVSKNKPAVLCTSHGGDLYGLNDPISKIIKRYVIKNVEALTVVSTAMQLEVKKLVSDTDLPTVVPMGTDLQGLFTPDKLVQRKSYQLLFVGRLVEKKGLQYLLKALPEILETYHKVTLNIAGTGPELDKLKKLVNDLDLKDHVFFLGRLSHKQLVTQYRTAALAVFPFVQAKDGDVEGLGLVMIEAMGCGCPVIASDIPAVRDVIIDGETGILVQSSNEKMIANKILRLLSMPDYTKKLADNSRELVLKKYGWEGSAQQYSKQLNKL